jgi:hypothetical protein
VGLFEHLLTAWPKNNQRQAAQGRFAMKITVQRAAFAALALLLSCSTFAANQDEARETGGRDVLAASALLAVDQNRTTIVERIVNEWGDKLIAAGTGVSRDQLKEMLFAMRADQLLAASLAGSLDGLKSIFVAATPRTGKAKIADAGGITPSALGDANSDLVYTPVTPCRLFDTRLSQGGMGTPTPGVRRTYGATVPIANQGGPGGCTAAAGAAVALIQIGTLTPSGYGLLQAGPQGVASFPNALILYQPGDQYGATVAMPLNPANGQFDLVEQFGTADLYGDLLGYFEPAAGFFKQGGNSFATTATLGTNDANPVEIYAGGLRVMRYEPNAVSANVIGGSAANIVSTGVRGATIAGGSAPLGVDPDHPLASPHQVTDNYGTIGGGLSNRAGNASGTVSDREFATVAGGFSNTASGFSSTVGGGGGGFASGNFSTVGGGEDNGASGHRSTISGGSSNRASGDYAWAGGRRAKTQTAGSSPTPHGGTFVWADGNDVDFNSAAANEFAARATGGVRFVTAIDAFGAPTWGCGVSGGAGGSWGCTSDRDRKTAMTPMDGMEVLAKLAGLPIYRWHAIGDHRLTPHAGPTAQDFMATFGLGDNDKMIGFADAQGVAFAAIQGLNAKLEEREVALRKEVNAKDAEIALLRADAVAQKQELAELRRAVEVLMARTSPEGKVAQSR